jgi:hypothetical protein
MRRNKSVRPATRHVRHVEGVRFHNVLLAKPQDLKITDTAIAVQDTLIRLTLPVISVRLAVKPVKI